MPEDFDPADYRTPAEVARLWGVRPDTVRSWIRNKVLPAVRIGRKLYVHRDARRPYFEELGGRE